MTRHVVHVKGYGDVEAEHGSNLGRILASKGILPLPCGGRGFCGQCVVRVKGPVSPPTGNELVRGLGGDFRLACQTHVLGDLEVELLYKPLPKVSSISMHLEVTKPQPMFTIIKPLSGYPVYRGGPPVEASLKLSFKPGSLVGCCGSVRGAVSGDPLVSLVDLGTTKIAYQLLDVGGGLVGEGIIFNPLSAYGADIMTRLTAALEDSEASENMRRMLVEAVASITPMDRAALIAVAGNSVMESFFLGLPLEQLGEKPFQPFIAGPFAGSLGGAALWVAPMIGGFVGGDAAADLAAAIGLKARSPFLIIDLGTNTEVLLYTGKTLYAASTPAGPAFEEHVERGTGVGAAGISRVRIAGTDEEGKPRFEVSVAGEGEPLGLLGSGVISLAAELSRHGFIGEDGRIRRGYVRIRGVKAIRIGRGLLGDIYFTQRDVREFQKAMASIKAAWRIVLGEAGVKPSDLRTVFVAGNLGSSVDPGDLLYLGLIPPVREENVVSTGNMVLPGLKAMVFDSEVRGRVEGIMGSARLVELAEHEGFMDEWVRGLSFPR